ncbi:MAG: hypothetical protein BroJett025_02010 [Patescibacteria group bacterium]|nr:MAG: hypothetical protein BroJett025_02010 [Patescibacteria group bacterium]
MTIHLPFWIPIHTVLATNQKTIKSVFFILYLLGFLGIGFGFFLFNSNLELYVTLAELATKFGTISLYLFLLTLVPGILQRLNVVVLLSTSVVLFRRQIGIVMYILALLHSFYLSIIPQVMTSDLRLQNFATREIYGLIAILILFPVWITSNDVSQKKFGRFWKSIQRLTYIAMFFIYLHVAAIEKSAQLLTAIVILLEIISWIKIWLRRPTRTNLTS